VSPNFLISQLLFLQAFHAEYMVFLRELLLHLHWYIGHPSSLFANAHQLPRAAPGLWISLSSPATTYWSLSIEEYFYLFWAPVVLRASRNTTILAAILICVLETALRWYYPGDLSYFGIFFRFDSLLYGAILAIALEKWNKPSHIPRNLFILRFLFLLGVLGVVASLLLIRPVLGYEIRDSPLIEVVGIPSFCLAAAAILGMLVRRAGSSWWLAKLLRTPIFQFLGVISYTMYLVHVLAALLVMMAIHRLMHVRMDDLSLSASIVSAFLTVLIARLSWHYLEKPLLRWKDRRFPATKISELILN
jgi:peptidoglycan/LPS O-acetylase OafA/YrhL